ncbi:MAG: DUF4297 domain-containing protein [Desulfobacterales bacterium]|nr:DUF4297 domain-containing protein [Desulfobacterales bacterium]
MNQIESTLPSEDSGTLAQSRFFYQHQYTAFWCIQMLVKDEIEHIICEHHDDLLIRWRDGHYDFIQVKTRDEGLGEWTLADLLRRTNRHSIIEKLYEKKRKFGDSAPHCYAFVSNMGASGRSNDLKALKELVEQSYDNWGDDEKEQFEIIFKRFKRKVTHDDSVDLRDFCLSLRIWTWQPNFDSIRPSNIDQLQKALKSMQGVDFPYQDLEKIYDAILQVVHRANIAQSIEDKIIRPEHIKAAIEAPVGADGFLERVETVREDLEEMTSLERKAKVAKFDPDVITLLIDLRASANAFYRKYSHFDFTKKRLQHLSLRSSCALRR